MHLCIVHIYLYICSFTRIIYTILLHCPLNPTSWMPTITRVCSVPSKLTSWMLSTSHAWLAGVLWNPYFDSFSILVMASLVDTNWKCGMVGSKISAKDLQAHSLARINMFPSFGPYPLIYVIQPNNHIVWKWQKNTKLMFMALLAVYLTVIHLKLSSLYLHGFVVMKGCGKISNVSCSADFMFGWFELLKFFGLVCQAPSCYFLSILKA